MTKKLLTRKITWIRDRDINGNYGYINIKTGEFRTTLPNSLEEKAKNKTKLNKAVLVTNSTKQAKFKRLDANKRNHSDETYKKKVEVPYINSDSLGNLTEGTMSVAAPSEDSALIDTTLEGLFVGDRLFRLGSGLTKLTLTRTGNNGIAHWARNSLLDEASKDLTKRITNSAILSKENLAAKQASLGDNTIESMSYYKPMRRAWANGNGEGNSATSYFFRLLPNLRFELVKDLEPNNYSVHFKTDYGALGYGLKMLLFAKLADEIPEGANISTWGSVSKGGLHGVERFGRDFGFRLLGTRLLTMKGISEPVNVGIFLKPLNHHLQGEDAVKMFKEYGGTLIPKGSINGNLLRMYVNEAKERYGLVGNNNISDEEIAQALYKHANELGRGTAAVNALGEPLLLFRGDTKAYTLLRTHISPKEYVNEGGTMDNSLGTLFTGEFPGTMPDRFDTMGSSRYLDGWNFNPIENTWQWRGGGTASNFNKQKGYTMFFHLHPNPIFADRGQTVGFIKSASTSEHPNDLNAFVVRTPAMRDATREISVLNDDWLVMLPSFRTNRFKWDKAKDRIIDTSNKVDNVLEDNPNFGTRLGVGEHYTNVLKNAQENKQGLLKSSRIGENSVTPDNSLREEHSWYSYFVLPDFNRQNAKHLLPYDLRIPRNWNNSNIFRVGIPTIFGLTSLSNNR